MLKDIKKFQIGGLNTINQQTSNQIYKQLSKDIKQLDKETQSQLGAFGSKYATSKGGFSNLKINDGVSSILGGIQQAGLKDDRSKAINSVMGTALNALGPVGMAINFADNALGAFNSIAGLNLNTLDSAAASRAGLTGANNANAIISGIPIVGSVASWFGGKTNTAYKSAEIDKMSGAYGGSTGDINTATDLSGKRLLFGKNKANSFIAKANDFNTKITNISLTNNARKASGYGENIASQNFRRYTGTNTSNVALAKEGLKLTDLEFARNLLQRNNIVKFQSGGKVNVIVEGALHAHKHNLTDVNPDLEGITKKGIPVISFEEGGELVQSAEVEEGELILTKEVTEQLETLYKDGSDEAMITAGKLLTEEIIEFTDDKTSEIISED